VNQVKLAQRLGKRVGRYADAHHDQPDAYQPDDAGAIDQRPDEWRHQARQQQRNRSRTADLPGAYVESLDEAREQVLRHEQRQAVGEEVGCY